jgi:hypothetical protein
VFYKLIQSIRAKESRLYFILSIGRSLEKVINTIGVTVCGFAYFLFLDLTQFGNELTTSKIFSTIYLMFYIKTLISFSGTALNFYFELGIIFERFCNILNI